MNAAGYSGTPLAKKLGIKEGYKIRLINQPAYYFDLFTDLPTHLQIFTDKGTKKNFLHYFATAATDLQQQLPLLKDEIVSNGMIWVSWPRKAAKIKTDLTEDTIRAYALPIGLVDIKVCAVDEIWSGLKLVIRVKERK